MENEPTVSTSGDADEDDRLYLSPEEEELNEMTDEAEEEEEGRLAPTSNPMIGGNQPPEVDEEDAMLTVECDDEAADNAMNLLEDTSDDTGLFGNQLQGVIEEEREIDADENNADESGVDGNNENDENDESDVDENDENDVNENDENDVDENGPAEKKNLKGTEEDAARDAEALEVRNRKNERANAAGEMQKAEDEEKERKRIKKIGKKARKEKRRQEKERRKMEQEN